MIFNRSFSLSSSKSSEELIKSLTGQHFKVHTFDFEIFKKDDILRIIPHAEDAEGVVTLPIGHILFKSKNNTTQVKIETHPRRIDIGGPYILIVLCAFAFIAGYALGHINEDYNGVGNIMMGFGALVGGIFWIRMEMGYFDYVRKIKAFVKSKL